MNKEDVILEVTEIKELARRIYLELRNNKTTSEDNKYKIATIKGIFDYMERIRIKVSETENNHNYSIPLSDVTLLKIISDTGGYSLQGNNPPEVEKLFIKCYKLIKSLQLQDQKE